MALKTMAYGGVYLVGGVTKGLEKSITGGSLFIDTFNDKGRLSPTMEMFPVFLVDPKLELGMRGSTERARREAEHITVDTHI